MNSQETLLRKFGVKEVCFPINKCFCVTNFGKVYNSCTGHLVQTYIDTQGYTMVVVIDDITHSEVKLRLNHILADTFISNPDNKTHVIHLDGNKQNNDLNNLKWGTINEIYIKGKPSKLSKSGVRGVGYNPNKNKWYARIKLNGKEIHLGYYNNFEDAKVARQKKEIELFN